MDIQYAFGILLVLGGFVTAWISPDLPEEKPDGTFGPVTASGRVWLRVFGVACVGCGFVFLVITALGLWGPGAPGPPTP